VLVGYVTSQIERRLLHSFALLEERNRVTNLFGQHVSPAVVEKLLTQSEFTSEIRHVCMMFFDIRNFTSFSESKHPEEVVNYLNLIFDFSIDIINRHGGIINKFLGDGFMAVFGAPISSGDDIQNAVKASLEIIDKVKTEIEKHNIPQTKIGIGLHAGDAVTGNVGSSKRKEYTIIGDVVNLASRIEQLNKSYSSQLLVSEEVWSKLTDYSAESLGEIVVKGREKPVRIYRLA
ncbi:MAG TPA: adenylate/guanylate cyclase domain-containing protein, partial [Leptospiraceae bacterium]|nr:adenylate/guanylate cyclase domain-containing protein [Leptospiraceae bacterium]